MSTNNNSTGTGTQSRAQAVLAPQQHFSTITNKWEPCGARMRSCRYGQHRIAQRVDEDFGSMTAKVFKKLDQIRSGTSQYPTYISDDDSILTRPYAVLNKLIRGRLTVDDDPKKPNLYRQLAAYVSSNPVSGKFDIKYNKLCDKLEDENYHGPGAILAAGKALHQWSITKELPLNYRTVLRGVDLTDPRSRSFINAIRNEAISKELARNLIPNDSPLVGEKIAAVEDDVQYWIAQNTSQNNEGLIKSIKETGNYGAMLSQAAELVRRGRKDLLKETLDGMVTKDYAKRRYIMERLKIKS